MSVRSKTLLIIAVTSLLLIGALYSISRFLLLDGFIRLEQESVQRDMLRMEDAIQGDIESVDRIAADVATWDKSYEYMENPTPDFLRAEFGEGATSTLVIQQYDALAFIDTSGHVVSGLALDPGSKSTVGLDPKFVASIDPASPLIRETRSGDRKSTRLNSSHQCLSRMPSSA